MARSASLLCSSVPQVRGSLAHGTLCSLQPVIHIASSSLSKYMSSVHRQSVLLFEARNIFASGLQAVHRHEQVFIEVSRCPSHCKSQGQHIQNHAFIPALGMTKGQNLLHTCCSPKAWPRDKPPWQLNSEASETMQCHKCSIGK